MGNAIKHWLIWRFDKVIVPFLTESVSLLSGFIQFLAKYESAMLVIKF